MDAREELVEIFHGLHAGWADCLDAGVVDQDVQALAIQMLLDFHCGIGDTGLAAGVELDEYDATCVSLG